MAWGTEGLGMMVLNFLKVPPGSLLRKQYGSSGQKKTNTSNKLSGFVNSIVDITVDDVCIGNSPFYLSAKDGLGESEKEAVLSIVSQFNSESKNIARDLLAIGISVYDVHVVQSHVKTFKEEFVKAANNLRVENGLNPIKEKIDNIAREIVLIPRIDDFEVYMTKSKDIVVYCVDENGEKKALRDCIVFLNYTKQSLSKIEQGEDLPKSLLYKVVPEPIQVKNCERAVQGLENVEKTMSRYRTQLGRVVRYATVDVGVSQGDKQDSIVDQISSAINANSSSLDYDSTQEFDDAVPVIPVRGAIGKPELQTDIPTFDMKQLVDLDYFMGQVLLCLRFPKTYVDFSQNLDQSAVSMIRGDVRYSRMITQCRTLIEDTVNAYLQATPWLDKSSVKVSLTSLPTPEDDDVMNSIDSYSTYSKGIYTFIVDDSETVAAAVSKLHMLRALLSGATNVKSVNNLYVALEDAIGVKFSNEVSEPETASSFSEEPEGFDEEFSDNSSAGAVTGGEQFDMDSEDIEPSTQE